VNPELSKRSVANVISALLATDSIRYSVHTIRQSIEKRKRWATGPHNNGYKDRNRCSRDAFHEG